MIRSSLFILVFVIPVILHSQVPGYFTYQAVVRDGSDQVIANQNVAVQIRILEDSISSSSIYTENFYTQSNNLGRIEFSIGSGIVLSGDFNSIDWSQPNYYIWIGMDLTGGTNYLEIGREPFASVPYAKYAQTSGSSLEQEGIKNYTQQEIDNLTGTPGAIVFNTTTHCLNFFNGTNWTSLCGEQCFPMPSIANAGTNQSVQAVYTNLAGNVPNYLNNEVGTWSIIVGSGGTISEPSNPNSIFSGLAGQSYLLAWTLSTSCGSNSSTVSIEFLSCYDGNPCTYDYYLNGFCQHEPILPAVANAGPDQLMTTSPTVLDANPVVIGVGSWSIVSGSGGLVVDPSDYQSAFEGIYGTTYELVWHINHTCGSSSDTVVIIFHSAIQCGTNLTDARDNKEYSTIDINGRCWMAENLNYGNFVTSGQGPQNNAIAEKYCYGNNPANCPTMGGLYTWDELMNYSTIEYSQGLCPDNWHVPTDLEWYDLEHFVDSTINDPLATGFRGVNAAAQLIDGGSSGLDLIYSGTYYQPNSQFLGGGSSNRFANYATSSVNGSFTWIHVINENYNGISRLTGSKQLGNAVRCVQNYSTQPCLPWPGAANAGPDQTWNSNGSANLMAYTPALGTGQWSVAYGTGGNFSNDTLPASSFTGAQGENYQLVWTASTACGSSSDTVFVSSQNPPLPSLIIKQWGSQSSNLGDIEIVDNPCIKGNGINAFVLFSFPDVANISSVEVSYFNGSNWNVVLDNVAGGSSVPGLWQKAGASFYLLTDGVSYFDNKVSFLVCKNAAGDEVIHANFTETRSTRAFNRARHTRDGDGVYTNFSTFEFVVDDGAYPVAMLEGFDNWESNYIYGEYVVVPYHIDGTPLLSDGDSWTDYSWVTNHPPITGTEFHNSAPSKIRISNDQTVLLSDLDNVFSNGAGTRYKLSFDDLKEATMNPLFFEYGNHVLKNMVLYNQELSGTNLIEAKTHFGVKAKNNFVFHGDSHSSEIVVKPGWGLPAQYFRTFEERYQATVLANPGWTSAHVLSDVGSITAHYDMTKDHNYAIIFVGANDIMLSTAGPNQVYVNLQEIWSTCRDAGFFVVAVTLLPHHSNQANIDAVNQLIKSDQTLYDLLIDISLDPDIGATGADLGPYYQNDHIHMTEEGTRKLADLLIALIPG
jgi:uncharacterized protein (TIGR02145 family)